ncbi:two-component sensor histidine kinase [Brenneria goodwinii]|uniref:histidine kinase n=1 Tax=Brenneria goodwinii TaxID=1109412 RepID=A0A0G4JQE1_9GAMM|nr:ATP-binding protein [Brenneria goodwinii]ATA25125.1 sensor histidine kinase [Brenneria goodwinii]RLM18405.1 two-component sensor histidine kinase [Brenneria goodwinii]CPR14132.1 two-component system sensor protein [Brenneria goodwinii]
MKNTEYHSLWRWICVRILALAIGTVIVIALCMWLRFAIQNIWVLHHMPPALREEFEVLRQHPETNLARFHQIVDTWWGVSYSEPSIVSADWLMVGVLVVVMIPFIVVMGLKSARPLSVQFSRLAAASEAVTRGKFGTQAELVEKAPTEMARFARDFNAMTHQLARYEHEMRASHVALAHELRSPLTAAIGRLQGVIDGVFRADGQQLGMVMKQLQHLNRLIDELHLLSLAEAGRLELDRRILNLAELLRERAAWLKPQLEKAGMSIRVIADMPCTYVGDAFRLGQAFTVLMENALRYASEGKRLTIKVRPAGKGCQIAFRDYGPGVDAEFLSGMFERFTRADSSRARHSGGSGLGLSIARAICAAHGGSIHAALPADKGLLITIHLPETGDI